MKASVWFLPYRTKSFRAVPILFPNIVSIHNIDKNGHDDILYGVLRRGRGAHTRAMDQGTLAVSVPREIVGPRRVGDDLGAPEVQSERR